MLFLLNKCESLIIFENETDLLRNTDTTCKNLGRFANRKLR